MGRISYAYVDGIGSLLGSIVCAIAPKTVSTKSEGSSAFFIIIVRFFNVLCIKSFTKV